MTDAPQLDSAAAVEVAAFCWPHPDGEWGEGVPGRAPVFGLRAVCRVVSGEMPHGSSRDRFDLTDFNDLHRAAAVLVGRGFGLTIATNLMRLHQWPEGQQPTAAGDLFAIISAPADAWARAILATVREVSK